MQSARISTLATLRGSIERLEASGDAYAPGRVALGHADADATHARGVCRSRPAKCRGDRFCRRSCGADGGTAAPDVGATGFCRDRIRRVVDERVGRTRSRSTAAGDRACGGCGHRIADGRRCAGLRCAWRRGAGGLGAGATARSRRQPQADAGRAGLRRHRPGAAGGGGAVALDGGDQMDRARGAFAAGGPL